MQSSRPELYSDLEKSLTVDYDRITVVDRDLKEKMTLDFNLVQQTTEKSIEYNNLVIVEVKQPSKSFRQTFNKALKGIGARTTGMSKYCIGLSYLQNQMKSNLFKPQLLFLKKHFNPRITAV